MTLGFDIFFVVVFISGEVTAKGAGVTSAEGTGFTLKTPISNLFFEGA